MKRDKKDNVVNEQIREDMDPELLIRYCKGQCTEGERKEVEAAMEASGDLRKHIHHLRMSLSIADDIREIEAIDINKGYARTRETIKKMRTFHLYQRMIRIAAMLTIPLLLSSMILGYLYFSDSEDVVQYAEVTSSEGTIVRYELPDKSVVWLNSGSTLRYPARFDKGKREVDLKGEAYFDVQANTKHPFYVNTPGGISVYVYGTQFNVNAYDEDSTVETVLEEGSVNVIAPDKSEVVKLAPGERLIYDKQTHQMEKMNVDVYEKTAWKDGKLIFRNASIEEVLKRLSRHFNVDIEFHNLTDKKYNYRATFKEETLTQILDYLSKSATLKWEMEEPVQNNDESFTKKKIVVKLY